MRNVQLEIKATLVWIALATVVGLAGFWQAKVAVEQDSQTRHKVLPPPKKTRVAIRPTPEVFTGNVVEDYIARCRKGLTDREIGWILEDFRDAGLDQIVTAATPAENLFKLRAAQYHWYLNALKDGLRLSDEQYLQAAEKLSENMKSAKQRFSEESAQLADFVSNPDIRELHAWAIQETSLQRPQSFTNPWSWLQEGTSNKVFWGEALMPWSMSSLTPEQERITWREWYRLANLNLNGNHRPDIERKPFAPDGPSFMRPEPLINTTDISAPSLPLGANFLFPLITSQNIEPVMDLRMLTAGASHDDPNMFLDRLRCLHPAQLKSMLLFAPRQVQRVQFALDNASQ